MLKRLSEMTPEEREYFVSWVKEQEDEDEEA